MDSTGINQDIGKYINKMTANNFFKGALLIMGVAFTVSTVMNNYYSIRYHRERIKAEKARAKNGG